MKRDHAGIETDVQHVRALLTEWAAAPEKKEPLREALLALQGKVLAHLDDEERSIMPVAAQVLTQAEWDMASLQGRKETPRNRLLISLGYLQRCAPTKALADSFWHKVPSPVRLLYRLFGKRKFEREWEALYGK
ncbi:MAG: hypothetical protein GX653_01250 [Clostridiales bacterium]|nr:hypothetical protein [Clostridiales bacterium]